MKYQSQTVQCEGKPIATMAKLDGRNKQTIGSGAINNQTVVNRATFGLKYSEDFMVPGTVGGNTNCNLRNWKKMIATGDKLDGTKEQMIRTGAINNQTVVNRANFGLKYSEDFMVPGTVGGNTN
jgi:polyisoprenoid-binding protein YceI